MNHKPQLRVLSGLLSVLFCVSILITPLHSMMTLTASAENVPTLQTDTITPTPVPTTEPVVTPEPVVTAEPTATPVPSATAEPTATPVPSATVEPTATPVPSATTEPTTTPAPSATVKPTATPAPSATVKPTATPVPSATVKPTATPVPSATIKPTATPKPSASPDLEDDNLLLSPDMPLGDMSLDGILSAPNKVAPLDIATDPADTGSYVLTLPAPEAGVTPPTTYDISFTLTHRDANNPDVLLNMNPLGDETFDVVFEYPAGSTTPYPNAPYLFKINTAVPEQLVLSLNGLPAGTKITLQNVRIRYILGGSDGNYTQNSYIGTDVLTSVKPSGNAINNVDFSEGSPNPASLTLGDTVTVATEIVAVTDPFDRKITDDFLAVGGRYNILHMLSHYNVVSLDNIESTHIVGPILAVDIAQRTHGSVVVDYGSGELITTQVAGADEKVAHLAASDYANGTPSYVGTLIPSLSNIGSSAFKFEYGFENTKPNFQYPNFYTRETGITTKSTQTILEVGGEWWYQDYIGLSGGSVGDANYLSPNATGLMEKTWQNDAFISLDALSQAMNDESQAILAHGNAASASEVEYADRYYYTTDGNGNPKVLKGTAEFPISYDPASPNTVTGGVDITAERLGTHGVSKTLKIAAGESWMILDAKDLEVVDFDYPEDYDYFKNPYPIPTTINFVCAEINPTTLDIKGDGTQVTHSQLPGVLINGDDVRTDHNENGEYGEGGQKIIWNMPNVVTDSATGYNRLSTYGATGNLLGHIVAPNAEFWNYGNNEGGALSWEGGNINGSVIVKSFYSGNAEIHMWPYDGANEKNVQANLSVTKAVNGEMPHKDFSFALTPTEETANNSGLANKTFPIVASTSVTGENPSQQADFSALVFIKAGTYQFILKEKVPDFTNTDGIVYDESEYLITITVIDDATAPNQLSVQSITRTRIKDKDGNDIAAGSDSSFTITKKDGTAVFTYADGTYENANIWFDNRSTDTETVNVQFIKRCADSDHPLAGAVFHVSEMANDTDLDAIPGGYFATVTSDTHGLISITGLKHDTYYVFYEQTPPPGYTKDEGYWIIYVDDRGNVTTTAHKGAHDIEDDDYIYNTPETPSELDLVLTKSDQYNIKLSGVAFLVQRVKIENNLPVPVVGGYSKTFTSGADGAFTVEGLSGNRTYMITEQNTPDGYKQFTGYWLIETERDEAHPSGEITYTVTEYTQDHQVVAEITDDTLRNEKIEYTLPNTGGSGASALPLLGLGLMALPACIAWRKRKA